MLKRLHMRQIFTRLLFILPLLGFCFSVLGQNGTLVSPTNPSEVNETIDPEEIRMQMHDITGLPVFIHDLFYHPVYDLRIFRIEYLTENNAGQEIIASGLVLIPNALPCHTTMAVYCHRMVLDEVQPPLHEVPSNFNFDNANSNDFFNIEKVIALGLASDGYVTVLPDYIGLGQADLEGNINHLFLDKRTQATATLDAIRAARQLINSLGYYLPNENLYLTGYSQGAHAAMSTLEYINDENLKQEFRFVNAVLSSGPYDLGGVQLDYLNQSSVTSASIQAMRDYFETSCSETFPGSLDDCYQFNTNSNWNNVFPSIPIMMEYCTADQMFPGTNALVAKEYLQDGVPEYQFWERQRIQSIIAGAYQHSACSVPSMFAAKLGHDIQRGSCLGERETEVTSDISILLAEDLGIKHNHFGSNYLVLDVSNIEFVINRAEFLNIKGKIIKTDYNPISIRDRVALDVRDLKEGVYAVRLHTNVEDKYWLGFVKTSLEILETEDYEPVVTETSTTHKIDFTNLEEELYTIVYMDYQKEVLDMFTSKGVVNQEFVINKEWMKAGLRLVEIQTPSWSHTFYFTPDNEGDDGMQEGRSAVSIDPNPVKGTQQIRVDGIDGKASLISLYDLTGQLVTQNVPQAINNSSYLVNVPSHLDGIYLLRIHKVEGQEQTSRIVFSRQ